MPRIQLRNASVLYPMHLDERAKSIRYLVAAGGLFGGARTKYKHGLNSLTLTARTGDRIGVLGRNGSGKTTLLRTIAGIYEPDEGSVIRIGKTVSMINLTMGMDMYASGYENIRRRAMLYGVDEQDLAEMVSDVATFSDLGTALGDTIRTYSSGMLARLSFGIATSIKADIILMDEWISAGDFSFIEKAESRMNSFLSDSRILVLATHSEALVRKWCNKVLVLSRGQKVFYSNDIEAGIQTYRNHLD